MRREVHHDQPCMGGWQCPKREDCAHYHSEATAEPDEWLCRADAALPYFVPSERVVEIHLSAAA